MVLLNRQNADYPHSKSQIQSLTTLISIKTTQEKLKNKVSCLNSSSHQLFTYLKWWIFENKPFSTNLPNITPKLIQRGWKASVKLVLILQWGLLAHRCLHTLRSVLHVPSKLQILSFQGQPQIKPWCKTTQYTHKHSPYLLLRKKAVHLIFLPVIISPKSPKYRDKKCLNELQDHNGPSTSSGPSVAFIRDTTQRKLISPS